MDCSDGLGKAQCRVRCHSADTLFPPVAPITHLANARGRREAPVQVRIVKMDMQMVGSRAIFCLCNQTLGLVVPAPFRLLDVPRLRFEGESIKIFSAKLSTGRHVRGGQLDKCLTVI
jgi:hypothetical protein